MVDRYLLKALAQARENTDRLFGVVRPDSFYERPIPERHRIVFYLGHVEAFDWNLIARGALEEPAFHKTFDQLFSFGIDPNGGDLPRDTPEDWPRLDEVQAYNARVREKLDALLLHVPDQLLHVAIEHRLMHAETFAYMLHNLPFDCKNAALAEDPALAGSSARLLPTEFVEIPAGAATLGRKADEGFGWDNEFEAHGVEVPAFAISRRKVTNGEYLAFVRDGAPVPHFWTGRNGKWFWRGMFGEVPLPLDAPVYVTQAEASAYARWAGAALPAEAQFQRGAYGSPEGAETAPEAASANVNFRSWDPVPADAGPPNAFGLQQMVGNGWEWTSTLFHPFPGFAPFPFYPGYSANFFDGQHFVLKGASPRTAACFLRPSFRNWFRPEYPYVYSGFRLVKN